MPMSYDELMSVARPQRGLWDQFDSWVNQSTPNASTFEMLYGGGAHEAAAARQRNAVQPQGGRKEGTATALLDSIGSAVPKSLAGLGQSMVNYSANEFPGTFGVTSQSTDYDPRREAAGWAAGTAMNMVGAPALTGGVPAEALGSAAKGIRAYHGSPHDFDRFDMSKIGTGEGAQAYGHGLYFAENEKVARQYRDDLSNAISANGQRILANNRLTGSTGNKSVDDLLIAHNGDVDAAIADLTKHMGGLTPGQLSRAGHSVDLDALNALRGKVQTTNTGKMYEVNINAHPDQFLDWDKPLPKTVPEQFIDRAGLDSAGATGADLYRGLSRQIDPFGAAHNLREAGIPGIRYLDQGSRNPLALKQQLARVGDSPPPPGMTWSDQRRQIQEQIAEAERTATSNYVVFDDKLIDILKKYGLAGMLGGTGALAPLEQRQ